jgi:hypothetical protein
MRPRKAQPRRCGGAPVSGLVADSRSGIASVQEGPSGPSRAMIGRPRIRVRRRTLRHGGRPPQAARVGRQPAVHVRVSRGGSACLALGTVEEGASRCALLALRLDQALPRQVSAGGFSFGHALFGSGTWEVVHFAFYGFATYNVLINPSDPVARTVLDAMVTSGDYFFFALDGDRCATAFRSSIGRDNLAGLKANMHRIRGSATTEVQYCQAVAQFSRRPEPPGTLLSWVCRGKPGYLDLEQDRLVLRPA